MLSTSSNRKAGSPSWTLCELWPNWRRVFEQQRSERKLLTIQWIAVMLAKGGGELGCPRLTPLERAFPTGMRTGFPKNAWPPVTDLAPAECQGHRAQALSATWQHRESGQSDWREHQNPG